MTLQHPKGTAVLLITCPDQKGLVASVSEFIYQSGGNIIHAEQHTDAAQGVFLQRIEWELDGFTIPREEIGKAFSPIADRFGMRWRRVINIHHSFLPAFTGARPYHQAHERGVKVIEATAHYVTEDLDQGPIIEQDVVRVTHRDSVADLVRKGRDLERVVLARAVRAHLLQRVLVYGNKTVVFD